MNRKRVLMVLLLISIVLLLVSSCLSPESTQSPSPFLTSSSTSSINTSKPASAILVQSGKSRITAPQVSESDLEILVRGNGEFAIDLYRAVKDNKENIFYSPYSISTVLAMAYAGARGETASQMAATLRFGLPGDSLHPAFNYLDIVLNRSGQDALGNPSEKAFRLNVVNAIWGQQGFEFLPEFLDVMAENYGAGIRSLDFKLSPEPSRVIINNWVSEQTGNRIEELLPPDTIDEATRLVLTNAVYFRANWENFFEKSLTHDSIFNLLDDNTLTVPMMKRTDYFGYFKGDGFQVVELPYFGRNLSMVVLLPDAGMFASFEESLSYQQVSEIIAGLKSVRVALSFPKFKCESSFDLKDTLSAMGMPLAFDMSADFTGISFPSSLVISSVVHKSFISVDEEGTEAAAASGVIWSAPSIPPIPVDVVVDRPFIFMIRDISTGTIIFLGRLMNPG